MRRSCGLVLAKDQKNFANMRRVTKMFKPLAGREGSVFKTWWGHRENRWRKEAVFKRWSRCAESFLRRKRRNSYCSEGCEMTCIRLFFWVTVAVVHQELFGLWTVIRWIKRFGPEKCTAGYWASFWQRKNPNACMATSWYYSLVWFGLLVAEYAGKC